MKSIEDEESKKIATEISFMDRKGALDCCAALGFTLNNTPGVDDIKPRASGLKGVKVDFDAIEIGMDRGDKAKKSTNRVDLGEAPEDTKLRYVPGSQRSQQAEPEEFIRIDVGEEQEFQIPSYNHKLRRKLRRAIDITEIRKEMLVRQRALDYYDARKIEAPPELGTPYKPLNIIGHRIMENGTLETAKQERVRTNMELAEFNTQMRVLRKQAKDAAIYAGLRKHAELLGRVPLREPSINPGEIKNAGQLDYKKVIHTAETAQTYTFT